MLIDWTAGYKKTAAVSVLLFNRFLGLLVISGTLHYICSISGYIKTVAVFWCRLFNWFLGLLVISGTLHYICSISGYIKTVAVFWCRLFNRFLGLWVSYEKTVAVF